VQMEAFSIIITIVGTVAGVVGIFLAVFFYRRAEEEKIMQAIHRGESAKHHAVSQSQQDRMLEGIDNLNKSVNHKLSPSQIEQKFNYVPTQNVPDVRPFINYLYPFVFGFDLIGPYIRVLSGDPMSGKLRLTVFHRITNIPVYVEEGYITPVVYNYPMIW